MTEDQEKPLTLNQLVQFYNEFIEPRFLRLEKQMEGLDDNFQSFRQENLSRFDDLYKKFEDLRQEYIVINAQLKRIDRFIEKNQQELKLQVDDLKEKVARLEQQIQILEQKLRAN